jgi:hypothetical protein
MKNPKSPVACLHACVSSAKILSCLFAVILFVSAQAQTTSESSFSNNNGNGQVTFNFQNNNSYPVKITGISSLVSVTGPVGVQAWYNLNPVKTATAPAITADNGWKQFADATIDGIANSTNTDAQPFFSDLSLVVPAGATYGICIAAANNGNGYLRYSSLAQGYYSIPVEGCNLITGTNIGWGGAANSATLLNNERGFIGKINVEAIGKPLNTTATIGQVKTFAIPGVTNAVLMPAVAHSNTRLRFVSTHDMKTEWFITDVNGDVVMNFTRVVSTGTNDILIPLEKLAAGVYQVTGNTKSGKLVSLKLIRQ